MTLETTLETRGCGYIFRAGGNPVKRGQDGEPDRQVFWGNGLHFWIEFKKKGTGRVRPGQKVFAKYLKAIGDAHYFIDTFEQLVEVVETWRLIHGPGTAHRDRAFNR